MHGMLNSTSSTWWSSTLGLRGRTAWRSPAIRDESEIPVVMLTGRAEEADRVMGLELGADDYITSRSARASCSRASARCCAAGAAEVRRESPTHRAYRFDGWELNLNLRRLSSGRPRGAVSYGESACWWCARAPSRILSRDQILDLSRLHTTRSTTARSIPDPAPAPQDRTRPAEPRYISGAAPATSSRRGRNRLLVCCAL